MKVVKLHWDLLIIYVSLERNILIIGVYPNDLAKDATKIKRNKIIKKWFRAWNKTLDEWLFAWEL